MPVRKILERLPPGAADHLSKNLTRVQGRIANALERAGRPSGDTLLVAVTKYTGAEAVRVLFDLGVRDFGESTVQGVEDKRSALEGLEGARWHLLGHLQRNKVARALEWAHAIHSIDSQRLAAEIQAQARRRALPVPELYIELELTGEPSHTGCREEQLPELLRWVRLQDDLAPRAVGLMAMAAHGAPEEDLRKTFRRLRLARDAALASGDLARGGLSMGMSDDFEIAIEEGSTLVRVGSALFEGLSDA